MNKDNIFVLTMFEKLTKEEDVYHIGQTHTMGWFPTMEDARYMLENNLGDLCRGKFAYAVIQEIGWGLYPQVESQHLFKAGDMYVKNKYNETVYNENVQYEEINIPDSFSKLGIIIGKSDK